MANENNKLVAIDNGCYVGDIKKLNDNELANAKNKKHKEEQKEQEYKMQTRQLILDLQDKIKELEHEVKVLKGEE